MGTVDCGGGVPSDASVPVLWGLVFPLFSQVRVYESCKRNSRNSGFRVSRIYVVSCTSKIGHRYKRDGDMSCCVLCVPMSDFKNLRTCPGGGSISGELFPLTRSGP